MYVKPRKYNNVFVTSVKLKTIQSGWRIKGQKNNYPKVRNKVNNDQT